MAQIFISVHENARLSSGGRRNSVAKGSWNQKFYQMHRKNQEADREGDGGKKSQ